MTKAKPAPLTMFLESLEDTRREASCDHLFIDILSIGVFSVMAGADGWEEMQPFGRDKKDWFETFLKLPHGIPSHDTFYPGKTHETPHGYWPNGSL